MVQSSQFLEGVCEKVVALMLVPMSTLSFAAVGCVQYCHKHAYRALLRERALDDS